MLELALILVGLCLISYITTQRPKGFPRGPPMLPIIGNLLHIDIQHPNDHLFKEHKKYGDVGWIVPFFKVVFLKDTKIINELLMNDNFTGRVDVTFNRDRFRGENRGIMFCSGPDWMVNKRFMLKNFRNFGMGKSLQESLILQETKSLLDDIQSYEGRPFAIEDLFYLVNINITWTLFGGSQFKHSDPNLSILGKVIRDSAHHFTIIGGVTVLLPFLRYLFPASTGYRDSMRNNNKLLSFVQKEIYMHKKTRDADNPRDLIDAYLDKIDRNENKAFQEKELEAMCCDAMVGGSDTGSATLAFVVLFMCIDKSIQQKMFDEIAENVGLNRLPNIADKARLVYCQAVIFEALRMRPPAPIILAHQALKDTTLGPYNIPKGTLVFPHIEAAFSDPNIWKNPTKFQPERFIADGKLVLPDSLMPFSRGKRACPGEGQARMTLFMVLVSLVQNYSFELPPGEPIPATEGTRTFLLAPPKFDVIATRR